jgi:heptosyltransferase-2
MQWEIETEPRRLLVRGVNWLGDAVMTTPALMRLRERLPGTPITLLTPEKLRDLWRHHPAVNEVITFAPGEGLFSVARKLRAGNFDLALILPNSPRSALEIRLAGIPERIGYTRPWRNLLLTQALPSRPGAIRMRKRSVGEIQKLIGSPEIKNLTPASREQELKTKNYSSHQLHDFLYLTTALGANLEPLAPKLFVTPEEVAAVQNKFHLAETSGPIFGLNAGAEYGPAKRWPVENFIAAAREIQKRTHCTWLILGGKSDLALATEIQSAIGNRQSAIHNLAGQTSLRELCALLKLCRVLLTNDTGPMHVAAALDTPVVVPFGSTSPELTGPGLPGDPRHRLLQSDAPCSPCFLRECPIDFRCMKSIAVERVVEGVGEVISNQ